MKRALEEATTNVQSFSFGKINTESDSMQTWDVKELITFRLERGQGEDTSTTNNNAAIFHASYLNQVFGESEVVRGRGSKPAVTVIIEADTLRYRLPEKPTLDANAQEVVDALTFRTVSACLDQPLFPTLSADLSAETWAPFGECIEKYECQGREFEVWWSRCGDDKAAEERGYHLRAQILALLLIDGASYIDVDDPNWEVFYVYEVAGTRRFLAGFTTIYRFPVPIGGDVQDRVRVSQVVVLPPFQRQGHGNHLYGLVHKEADRCGAFEVTVEDPAPGMVALRDSFDANRYVGFARGKGWEMDAPPEAAVVAEALRVPKAQAQRCIDLVRWKMLQGKQDAAKQEAGEKAFRLGVKRRLHKAHFSASIPTDQDEKKRVLAELYDLMVEEFRRVERKVLRV